LSTTVITKNPINKNDWRFSVVEVVGALAESIDAGAYWRTLKEHLKNEGSAVVTLYHGL
jgi:DNA-damage-inducible protein D